MILIWNVLMLLGVATWWMKKYAGDYKKLFWTGLVVKFMMGITLGLVYQYYYPTNDTWLFFDDASHLADVSRTSFADYWNFLWTSDVSLLSQKPVFTESRSVFLVKILSIFCFISSNNYWICAAWFSLFSFMASWYLFRIVIRFFEKSEIAAALSLLLFPSILFWSSGVVKETVALAGVYLITGMFIQAMKGVLPNWRQSILAIISIYVIWMLKYYWLAVLLPIMFTSIFTQVLHTRLLNQKHHILITWSVIFLLSIAVVTQLHPNFYLSRFLEVLVSNHYEFVAISDPDGLIHYNSLQASWWSVLINAPWALFSGLFRPFFWQASGMLPVLASVENLMLLFLTLSAMYSRWWLKQDRLLILSGVVYIIVLCVFLSLSTPNLGTLSRYRIGFLPVMVFIISYRNLLLNKLLTRIVRLTRK